MSTPHLIYLPGNSLGNKAWVETVKSHFDAFSTGQILYYDHWTTGEKWINLNLEFQKLSDLVKGQKDYFVFAKSIGTVLALKAINEKTFSPQKAIFCGHPFSLIEKEGLAPRPLFDSLTIPTLFIQNEFDPTCSFAELKTILKTYSPANYRLINNPGNSTHDYEGYNALSSLAREFFAP